MILYIGQVTVNIILKKPSNVGFAPPTKFSADAFGLDLRKVGWIVFGHRFSDMRHMIYRLFFE